MYTLTERRSCTLQAFKIYVVDPEFNGETRDADGRLRLARTALGPRPLLYGRSCALLVLGPSFALWECD